MADRRRLLPYINVAHTYDHLFMLLYVTVVLALEDEFAGSYGTLLSLATLGFVAFGAGTIPAGWLGDRWSRTGMMTVFFFGIGAASVLTGLARTPLEIGIGLTLIGVFGSIYHPVGIAIVVSGSARVGWALGINGLFGNLGVALAALVAGALMDLVSWRAAFIVPGLVSIVTGILFAFAARGGLRLEPGGAARNMVPEADRRTIVRVIGVLAVATFCGGLIFNSLTVAWPKVFDLGLGALAGSGLSIGALLAIVYLVAALSQLVVGNLIDRYPIKPVFLVVVALQVPALALAGLAVELPLYVIAFVVMIAVFGQIPIHDTLVARYSADAWRARIYGIKYLLSFGVSALAVPLVAVMHDWTAGFGTLFALLAGLASVILAALYFMPAELPSAVPTPARQPAE